MGWDKLAQGFHSLGQALVRTVRRLLGRAHEPRAAMDEYEPNDAQAYYRRGLAHAHQGHFERAISDYDRAIALKSDYADVFVCRGIARADRGELDQALEDFDQAIALEPDNGAAYYNRANAYAEQGDLDHAIVDWTLTMVFYPDDAAAYYNRGRAQALQENLEGAVSDFRKVLEISHDGTLRQRVEALLVELGESA
jgi:tetratricopeptide (TPR) repeat protein